MKRIFALLLLTLPGWGLVCGLPPARAGLPQPMCVYYGQARDGFGQPYLANADVILRRGTNEIARHTINGSLSPGVNFALYAHLDDGRSAQDYSPRALHSGDRVSIFVRDATGEQVIMENQTVPPVGPPGELVLINATAAEDADGDGLPDSWERELIAWSGGWLQTLEEVRGEDDFDGDGMSNWQEYRAGTFAFLDYDCFYVEYLGAASNRLSMTFLSVPGKVYSACATTNLTPAVWTPCPFSFTAAGPPQFIAAEGNGDWLSFFVPMDAEPRYFRLVVE